MFLITKKAVVLTTASRGTAVNNSNAIAVQSVYKFVNKFRLYYLRKSNHLSGARKFVYYATIFFTLCLSIHNFANPHTLLKKSFERCFLKNDNRSCELGSDLVELLQLEAASQNDYPCQTKLLGIQSDLLMKKLGAGRGNEAMLDFYETISECQ